MMNFESPELSGGSKEGVTFVSAIQEMTFGEIEEVNGGWIGAAIVVVVIVAAAYYYGRSQGDC